MFRTQQSRLLRNLDAAHAAYYTAAVFGGPSLHFHLRALDAARAKDCPRFAEASYAMLAAWGMHRMGTRGAKVREFSDYEASLGAAWPTILGLQGKQPLELEDRDWKDLEAVFSTIHAMASSGSLVGNSKVMAHAVPNLVPPVDREYTLRFLRPGKGIPPTKEGEWNLLRELLEGFFYPVAGDKRFSEKVAVWMAAPSRYKWDTSPLKVVDNLIIGLFR